MRRGLQMAALLVAVGAAVFWTAAGANRGWTKTNREKKTLDEVTGLEGISYEKCFSPGIDFVAATLLGAGALAGASFLFRNKSNTQL